MVLQYVQQNIAKNTGFIRFSSTSDANIEENKCLFDILSKIRQKQMFYKIFEQKQKENKCFIKKRESKNNG